MFLNKIWLFRLWRSNFPERKATEIYLQKVLCISKGTNENHDWNFYNYNLIIEYFFFVSYNLILTDVYVKSTSSLQNKMKSKKYSVCHIWATQRRDNFPSLEKWRQWQLSRSQITFSQSIYKYFKFLSKVSSIGVRISLFKSTQIKIRRIPPHYYDIPISCWK